MESEKEVALYYPFIDIKDPGLIKTAALYWDEIQTIVPEHGVECYKEGISKEAKDCGFLRARIVHSGQKEVYDASSELAIDLNDAQKKQNIIQYIKSENRKRSSGRPKYTPIYFEKFDPTCLLHIGTGLSQSGIYASPIDYDKLMLPTPLADTYMTRLATLISQKDGSIPLTNIAGMYNLMLDRYVGYAEERRQNHAQLASLSLQTISINSNVPLLDILRFRDRHRKEVLNYRQAIRKLSKQIGTGLNTTKRQDKLHEIVKDEILPSQDEIKSMLKEGDIALGFSAFDITQATMMGTLASHGENLLAGIGTGVISLTVSLIQSLREDRKIIKEHPFGYLYQANRKFGVKK